MVRAGFDLASSSQTERSPSYALDTVRRVNDRDMAPTSPEAHRKKGGAGRARRCQEPCETRAGRLAFMGAWVDDGRRASGGSAPVRSGQQLQRQPQSAVKHPSGCHLFTHPSHLPPLLFSFSWPDESPVIVVASDGRPACAWSVEPAATAAHPTRNSRLHPRRLCRVHLNDSFQQGEPSTSGAIACRFELAVVGVACGCCPLATTHARMNGAHSLTGLSPVFAVCCVGRKVHDDHAPARRARDCVLVRGVDGSAEWGKEPAAAPLQIVEMSHVADFVNSSSRRRSSSDGSPFKRLAAGRRSRSRL